MNVTTNSTNMNGTLSSLAASSQANWLSPAAAGLGGVCGRKRLKAARAIEAAPAATNVQRVAGFRGAERRAEPFDEGHATECWNVCPIDEDENERPARGDPADGAPE